MKALILYASRHGCTETCARRLKEQLEGTVDLCRLSKMSEVSLSDYETIIIGGSIHAGRIQNEVSAFCSEHLADLKEKKLGLFLCCMEEGQKADQQFREAFPGDLIDHAAATGVFGGEFNFERMNFIEKILVKKIARVRGSVSKIAEDEIEAFAGKIAR